MSTETEEDDEMSEKHQYENVKIRNPYNEPVSENSEKSESVNSELNSENVKSVQFEDHKNENDVSKYENYEDSHQEENPKISETNNQNFTNRESKYETSSNSESTTESTETEDHYEPSANQEENSNTISHTSSAASVTSGAPDIAMVRLSRKAGDRQTPLGLGLVSGMHTKLQHNGVFVKTLVPGGLAAQDGSLRVGDRIAAVNGSSIVACDYDQAIKLIRDSRRELRLLVIRARAEQAKLVLQPL
jgi:C-terminal processing protease CtpA/Prc